MERKLKQKRGRPAVVTEDAILLALENKVSATELATQLGTSKAAVSQACAKLGKRLPRKIRSYNLNSRALFICFEIFKQIQSENPVCQSKIAQKFGVSRQFVGKIFTSMKESGVKE